MDYRYLTETKNEFNNFLCGILVPHLYHGIKGMLKYSENVFNQIEIKNKSGAKINNPGVINIFKKTLDGLSSLNNHEIEEEYLRIKNTSGCVDWFDNLVRASFKSYVLFLTWDPKISNSKYSDNSIYESIVIKDFIHRCYVVSCNYFRDNPEIFMSKNSKKEIFEILKMCVEMSIKKSLPYNQIIQEYLEIEFDKTNDINSKEIQNIKTMVYDMMNEKKYGSRPQVDNLIVDDTGADEFVNLEDSEFKRAQLENFINQEKINEQNKINNESDNHNSDKSFKSYRSSKSYSDKRAIDSETSSDNVKSYNKLNNNQNGGESLETTKSIEQVTNSTNSINSTNSTNVTSTILSRAEMKNREIEELINDSTQSKNKKHIQTSDLTSSVASESESKSNNVLANKYSKTSEQNPTSELTKSKTSIENILSSPPVIRTKQKDKLNDLFELGKKIGGGETENKTKKNIKVTKHKNGNLSEKFDQVESFYDDMIKI